MLPLTTVDDKTHTLSAAFLSANVGTFRTDIHCSGSVGASRHAGVKGDRPATDLTSQFAHHRAIGTSDDTRRTGRWTLDAGRWTLPHATQRAFPQEDKSARAYGCLSCEERDAERLERAVHAGNDDRDAMVVVFGSANAFGRDVNEMELMLLTATVFVVSVLIVLVYKLARGWEEHGKLGEGGGAGALLPLYGRVTNKWVTSRKQHYGKLGTIMEHEVFLMDNKRM